jgi:hypothetical protein
MRFSRANGKDSGNGSTLHSEELLANKNRRVFLCNTVELTRCACGFGTGSRSCIENEILKPD